MYVRSLRLSGFKSFADPTVLEFEPGITVIVGPNGSGKSNIADAMSWVLGSQAPSNLRSGAMEDVIFAGSQQRPQLGMAAVDLTLNNESGVLPLDVSEVTLSRTTDRSGESEYRINGAACRLLDITELLSDTGIGRSLHALVGQGQLDQVLQARPEDRRVFIEEAAQIGKFRRRKDRALKKLDRVEDNLTRLSDVMYELKRAIRPLKRQATTAAAHSELMSEHQQLKQRLTVTELEALQTEEAELDFEGHERRSGLLGDELASVRARLTGAGQERAELGEAAERARQVAHRFGRATDRLEGLARVAEERAARLKARLASETEEGYRERIRLLEGDEARWRRETGELDRAASEAAAHSAEASRRATRSGADLARAEADLARARAEETDAAQALVRAEGSESANRATIGSIEARVEAVLERREVTQQELGDDTSHVAAAERESHVLEKDLDRATETAAAAEAALEEARDEAERLTGARATSRAERAARTARREALEEVETLLGDLPGASQRLAPVIAEARSREQDAVDHDEGAEAARSTAEEEVEGRWQQVARFDEELRRLDALMAAAVDRLTGARRRRERREIELAALNEELARARDALAAAERAAVEERAALPQRRSALAEASARREEAEHRAAETRAESDGLGQTAAEAELEARAAQERALGARLRLEEADAGIADARSGLASLEDMRAALSAAMQRAEMVGQGAALAAEAGRRWTRDAEQAADEARARAQEAESSLAGLRVRERELEQSVEEAVARRNRAEVRRAELRARSNAVAERALDEWGLSVAELEHNRTLDATELEEARARIDGLERQMRRLGPVNPAAAQEYEEAQKRQTFLGSQINDLQSSKADLLRVVRDVDTTIVETFGNAFEDVAREFAVTFSRLFPGGSGALKLSDPSDLLTCGIEIEARPPGKNVKKMSLLSGGERSLVALAFLFAIFRSRPSPFYLLDEVEAALDDVNLQRFLGLVRDLQSHAQVMIVTHQKRTMESADILYGVTMAKDGVSTVVAKRMHQVPTEPAAG
jgi:chromosome segregation protein